MYIYFIFNTDMSTALNDVYIRGLFRSMNFFTECVCVRVYLIAVVLFIDLFVFFWHLLW